MKTALERAQEAAARKGVAVKVVSPRPDSGTVTFLAATRDTEEREPR